MSMSRGPTAPGEGGLATERLVHGAGFPALAFFSKGQETRPLIVLLPGGGHLARIFYGYGEVLPDDFLLTHLARAGFSVLALSYPTSHPRIDHPVPAMTIADWARSCADIIADHTVALGLSRNVVAVGWSLAGRLARNLAVALRAHTLNLDLFVGLSAAPPMPGFGVLGPEELCLAPSGLRDDSSPGSPIFRSREAHLAMVDALNGRVVIPRDLYAREYVADSPLNFRGEAGRHGETGLQYDIAAAIQDQGSFDFPNYPLSATISGSGPSDAIRALTGPAAWAMLNAQVVYHRFVRPALLDRELAPDDWTKVRRLAAGLGTRLTREVEGSHLFFLGERGARETAEHVQALIAEADCLRSELFDLLGFER